MKVYPNLGKKILSTGNTVQRITCQTSLKLNANNRLILELNEGLFNCLETAVVCVFNSTT